MKLLYRSTKKTREKQVNKFTMNSKSDDCEQLENGHGPEPTCPFVVGHSMQQCQDAAAVVTPGEYYRHWAALEALQEAATSTSWLTVWNVLACNCCDVPHCWQNLPVDDPPVSKQLRSRIRWYDHVWHAPEPHRDHQHGATDTDSIVRRRELQAHFVGHHQRVELVLMCLQPSLDGIYTALQSYADTGSWTTLDAATAAQVCATCTYVASGWHSVAELMRGVCRMDRMAYLGYVPQLAGVSGGNSPHMLPLTLRTAKLEGLLNALDDAQVAHALQEQHAPLGTIMHAFIDCLDALSRCWLDHVVTATSTIGLTSGTKGTPNVILVDKVMHRLHHSRLLKVLGTLRVPMNTGGASTTEFGSEMKQLYDYAAYPLAGHYLDLFEDPGPEFGSHNVGWLPRAYDEARQEFGALRRQWRTSIWQQYYERIRPEFCTALSALLGIGKNNSAGVASAVGFGLGSSVTEVVARLVSTIQARHVRLDGGIWLPNDEFVTLQRGAALLGSASSDENNVSVHRLPLADIIHMMKLMASKREPEKMACGGFDTVVMMSLVNSCTQQVVAGIDWVASLPSSILVVLDVTQAVGNVPLSLDTLASRSSVFIVGSLIKHARCGEGLGFITYARPVEKSSLDTPASGWTAYPNGLLHNKTVDDNGRLLYDGGLEWEGGTPSWVEAAFVATRILRSMPPVAEQHAYVKSLQRSFLARLDLSAEQRSVVSESNTLAIPVRGSDHDGEQRPLLPYGLDYKIVNGTTYLRIGFGIHNLPYHLDSLAYVVEKHQLLNVTKTSP